jgi:hypothetical protein
VHLLGVAFAKIVAKHAKRLKKPIYGTVSAPKSLFDRLIEVCRAAGFITATTDEGLLIMTSGEHVVGVMALR